MTAVAALRKLPMAPMFEDFDDDVLVEVMLVDSIIDDQGGKAVVMFIPHGDPRHHGQPPTQPAFVPAKWFGELMPVSIFLDIPSDASALTSDRGIAHEESPNVEHIKPGLGEDLASRWRANKRPVAKTKSYVEICFRLAPPQLLAIALDAVEALESGRFPKSARGRIATFCELMSRHLDSLRSDEVLLSESEEPK